MSTLYRYIRPRLTLVINTAQNINSTHNHFRFSEFTSPTVWNSLPQSAISDLTVTTGTFKHRLKSAMYTRAFLQ